MPSKQLQPEVDKCDPQKLGSMCFAEKEFRSEQGNQLLIIGINDIADITGLSRSTIYRRIEDGTFPAPIKIGRRSFWKRSRFLSLLDRLEAASIH